MKTTQQYSVGIVGVRGYVGKELLKLITKHPNFYVEWLCSRQLEGVSVKTMVPELEELIIQNYTPQQISETKTDIIILALPNGKSEPYVKAIEKNSDTVLIIDLSADYRFDEKWCYSLPELDSTKIHAKHNSKLIKISNPGCYATAMQLALAPISDQITSVAHCFGISGYSGAGSSPCENNNQANLMNNIMPYALVEHIHEKEVSRRLNKTVSFSPHVASFFRGINLTLQVQFMKSTNKDGLLNIFERYYRDHSLVEIKKSIPNIQQVVNTAKCLIGGFDVSDDGMRGSIVSCLDNLLKGAASQAIQNINIACELNPVIGLDQFDIVEQ